MRTRHSTCPRGQSLIELVMVLAMFSALLLLMMVVGVVGDTGIRTSLAARLAAFDCDVRSAPCAQSATATLHHARDVVLHNDRGDSVAARALSNQIQSPADGKVVRSLHRDQRVIEHASDIRLSVDLPRVDGADKNLLAKLSDLFRGFSMASGPAIFGLPSPDQLTRSTVNTVLWASRSPVFEQAGMPRLSMSSRLAMISDSWAASDRSDVAARVNRGQTPSAIVAGSVEAFYLPAKDVLMPVLDAVGLESGTSAFRHGFHRPDHDSVFSNTRVRVP